MRRRSRLRPFLAAFLVTLLLVPLSVVQAAPVMQLAAPEPSVYAMDDEYAPAAEAEPAAEPEAAVDRGLEALGGPAGLNRLIQARRAELAPQQEALLQQQQAAAASGPRVQLQQPMGARPQTTGTSLQAGVVTEAPAAVGAPSPAFTSIRQRPEANLTASEPRIGVQAVPTVPNATLYQDREIFSPWESGNITFTLRYLDGSPYPGATIEVAGSSAVTDAYGVAVVPFTAGGQNRIDQVWVTLTGGSPFIWGEVYTIEPDYGLLVVTQVTDQNGTPVDNFDVAGASDRGFWGDWTDSGRVRAILPAGPWHVETTTSQATDPFFLYQFVTVENHLKTELHPSASNSVLLELPVQVDAEAQIGRVYLHNKAMPHPSWTNSMPPRVRVTPGTYDITWVGDDAEPVVLVRHGISLTADTNYPVAIARTMLTRVTFGGTDGHGATHAFNRQVTLQVNDTRIGMQPRAALVEPYLNLSVHHYGDDWADGLGTTWSYDFHAASSTPTPHQVLPDQPLTMPLGGPLNHPAPLYSCYQTNCSFNVQTFLTTPGGDRIVAYSSADGSTNWTPAQGTVKLIDPWGNTMQNLTVYADTWYQTLHLPMTASGNYTVVVDWPNLGPYAPPYHGEWTYTVTPPVRYEMTLTQTMLQPNTQATVTATVTRNGVPASGQQVDAGRYGSQMTDANGQATFTFGTPPFREVITFGTQTPELGYKKLAQAYVVPDGYGVVRLTEVTDRNGKPGRHFGAYMYWANTAGSYDSNGDWADPDTATLSMVRPAGTNHIEVQLNSQQNEHFLYRTFEVVPGMIQDVAVSGAGAVQLNVSATLDGAQLSGNLMLHNEAVPLAGWWDGGPPSPVWVTPGTYTVLYRAMPPDVLLTREHVSLQSATTLTFNEQTAGLSPLVYDARDGYGNPVNSVGEFVLRTPGFNRRMGIAPGSNILVSPGFAYAPGGYTIDAGSWRLRFENPQGNGAQLAAPNQPLVVAMGGPLTASLTPLDTEPYRPGQVVRFATQLATANGHHVIPTESGNEQSGYATLRGTDNNVYWSGPVSPWQNDLQVPLPQRPDTYTLELQWPVGPYGNPVTVTRSVRVPDEAVELILTPKVVPLNQSTTVTVQARRYGQPVSGLTINASWYGTKVTDANGTASFTVNESWATAIGIQAEGPYGQAGKTNLFVLGPSDAGVEIAGKRENGDRMRGPVYASAQVSTPFAFRSSSWGFESPVGVIVRSGNAFVELVQENADVSYVLNTTVPAVAGQVVGVVLDAAAAPLVEFRPSADTEAALERVSLHPVALASPYKTKAMGPAFVGGVARVRVTPGSYDLLAEGSAPTGRLIARFPARSINGGTEYISVPNTSLGQFEFRTTYAGAPVQSQIYLEPGPFEVTVPANTPVLANAGSYWATQLEASIAQASGKTWTYTYQPESGSRSYNMFAGASISETWPLEITSASVKVNSTYQANTYLSSRFLTLTRDGWTVEQVTEGGWSAQAPTSLTVTDPAGVPVANMQSRYGSRLSWRVPASPAASYTMAMSRDLGDLGAYSASAVTKLAKPLKLQLKVDHEIVPLGVTTPVRGTLTNHGRPVANARVLVYGETASLERTNARGQFVVPMKPTRSGTWTFQYMDNSQSPSTSVSTFVYALAPDEGLLDVLSMDKTGMPMLESTFQLVAPYQMTGSRSGGTVRKLIVPAGPATVVVRSKSMAGENYYLTGSTTVQAGASVNLGILGANAVPVDLTVANPGTAYEGTLFLRNTALGYTERVKLPADILKAPRVYVTPGTYEGLLALWSTGNVLSVLPVNFTAGSPGPTAVTLDAAAATATLNRSHDGQPLIDERLRLSQGGVGFGYYLDGYEVRLVPGTYSVYGYGFSLNDGYATWNYLFEGDLPVTVADGEVRALSYGAGLAARVGSARPVVGANSTVALLGGVYDGYGLLLSEVALEDSTGRPLGWEPNRITVTGFGRPDTFLYYGDRVLWTAPGAAGRYQLRFDLSTGPLAGDLSAHGSVQVIRLGGR